MIFKFYLFRFPVFLAVFLNSISATFCQSLQKDDFPQLRVWLRPDTLITLNSDSSISSWKDIITSTIYSSPTSTQQPKLGVYIDSMNGHPFISFDGNNDCFLSQSQISLRNKMTTILLVGKFKGPSFFGHLVCYGTNLNGSWNFREVNNSGRLSFINANVNYGAGTDGSGSQPSGSTSPLCISSNYAIVTASVDPGSGQWDIYENFENKHSTNVSFMQAASNLVSIGYRTDAGLFANFEMSELMIFDSVLTNGQISDLKRYLQFRYSRKVNLGADISFPYGFCSYTINAGSKFTHFQWSTGDTTQTILVNKTGTYWVATKDVFGFTSMDTIQIDYPEANTLTGNTVMCAGSTKIWNTLFSKMDYSFQWQDGSIDSALTITSAGSYWVKVTDTLGCYSYSDTITITVDNFSSIVSLGNDTTFCSGNFIYLKSGAGQATNYLWNDNSTNDSLTITTTGQYRLTVSNVNGCSKTDTINITIAGNAPTANFFNTSACYGNATNFTDLSTPPGGNTITKWLWNFGEPSSGVNDTSSLQNPKHIYADTGSYTVKLVVTTNAGCRHEINKIIRVYPNPLANFTTANLCNNEITKFVGTATTYGYSITQWAWDFGNPSSGSNNISSLQNPSHAYLIGANYTAQLIVQNTQGCKDTVSKNISIKLSPVTDFNYSLACRNRSVQFTDNSILPPSTTIQSSSWNFGDNGISSLIHPKHTFLNHINYTVTHIITASNGCKDTAVKTVNVYPQPFAYFSSGNSCINTLVDFTDSSVVSGGAITKWLWDFGSGGTSMVQNAKHLFTTSGTTDVKLTVTTALGCIDSTTKKIVIHPSPVANFSFTPPNGTVPLTVNFTNTSTGASTYVWDFGDQFQSTIVNPSHQYLSKGSYQILLTARSNFGCEKTITKMLEVLEPYLDVAIIDIATTQQNNFLNITVKIANIGNVDVTNMEFFVSVNDGPMVKENWTGLLQSNIMSYTLSSSIYLEEERDYVCISVLRPNGKDDAVAENNKLCKALDESEFKVLNIYPNPSTDFLTIPFIMPAEKMLTITIYNINGEIVRNAYSGYLSNGLQMVVINTMELTSGLYACKIKYENQTIIKSFIKY